MREQKLKIVKERLEKEKNYLISLLPESYRDEFRKKSYASGGAIYSLYNGKEPKDFDFFVSDRRLALGLTEFLKFQLMNRNIDYQLNPDLDMMQGKIDGNQVLVTDNGITYNMKYQIITKWVGEPEEVINEFDFKHNMFCYQNDEVTTFSQWDFLEDNKLRYNEKRARDICGTIIRVKKFVERGHTITNREMSKMLLKLHEVGFNERELEILERSGGFGS